MEDFCLNIGKLITGVGLTLDILGIIILVRIEILTHKIRFLEEKVEIPEEPKKGNPDILGTSRIKDMLAGKPIKLTEAEHLYLYNTGERNFKNSRLGFALLIVGFSFQLIALFEDSCFNL